MEVKYLRIVFKREGRDQLEYELLAAEQEPKIAKSVADWCERGGYDLVSPPRLTSIDGDDVRYRFVIAPRYVGDGATET